MLSVKRYEKSYVSACRDRVRKLFDAYRETDAAGEFEKAFLEHSVLALDHYFVHRMRGLEGKDGNALNEVRILCDCIKHHGGVMTVENAIRYQRDRSVLGLEVGAPISLSVSGVSALAEAFFDEIEVRYNG